MPAPLRTMAASVALAAATLLAACSSGGSDAGSAADGAEAGSSTTAAAAAKGDAVGRRFGGAHPCEQGATTTKVVTKDVKVPDADAAKERTDLDVTSFDGTTIRAHWFPLARAKGAKSLQKDRPVPTILMGPGWSLPGDTSTDGAALFGAASIKGLHQAGYNVLTWDPRGFGQSGGKASVNDPDVEGRDVRILMDWVAAQPGVMLDRAGDPRVGMVGFSYGGGIQLSVAATDCRVDALVPGLAWHSLHTSLAKADIVKSGWASFLYQAAVTGGGELDPELVRSANVDLKQGVLQPETVEWYESRGPGDRIDSVDVPTLFVSGTVDTLFTLDETITNYRSLRDRGIPTAMLWFCGGHGACLTKPGDQSLFSKRSYAWLARYLKGDRSVETGPRLDLVDQDGVRWTGDDFPLPAGAPVVAEGRGTLPMTADGGSGPVTRKAAKGDLIGGLVLGYTPAKATNAVDVKIKPGVDVLSAGAPVVTVTYRGTAGSGTGVSPAPLPVVAAPERAFAQLVDDDTGLVVGNQVTPFKVVLDGQQRTATVPLEVIAQHLRPGHTLTLQLVATTVAYAKPRLGGQIEFSKVRIELPTAAGITPTR